MIDMLWKAKLLPNFAAQLLEAYLQKICIFEYLYLSLQIPADNTDTKHNSSASLKW